MAYTLTIGGDDVTSILAAGARFREVASSGSGGAQFTLTGTRASAIPGASVSLTRNGVLLWEGTVTTSTPQLDQLGSVTATLVSAAPLSAQFNAKGYVGITQSVDLSTVFSVCAAQASVAYTPVIIGLSPGPLAVATTIGSLLSVAALTARGAWGVQNGSLVFLNPEATAQTSLPITFVPVSSIPGSIDVHGGLDAVTRAPLFKRVKPFGASGSNVLHFNCPEAIGATTMGVVADQLSQIYSNGSIAQTGVILPAGTNVRAGTWCSDTNGVIMPAWDVTHTLVAGDIQDTVNFGYAPLLPVSSNELDTITTRLNSDALVQGGVATVNSGLSFTVSDGVVLIGSATYNTAASTFSVPDNSVTQINATPTGYVQVSDLSFPDPGAAFSLYRVTTSGGAIVGVVNVTPSGGVGQNNFKPVSAANRTPTIGSQAVTLAAEGAAAATATVTVTLSGVTLDDTIQSIDLTWAIAGTNQWHPAVQAARAPGSLTFTGYIHGLAAGQAYDVGVQVRGQNEVAYPASPLLLGTSPTISASAVTAAIATWNEFGGTVNADGSWTNIDGKSSTTQYTLASGQPITISADIAKGATGHDAKIMLGNQTNGYACGFNPSGIFVIERWSGGSGTTLNSITLTDDTAYHSFRLTVTPGSPNTIEASFGANYATLTDSSLTLTAGTWPATLYTGGSSGKVQHYSVQATPLHIGRAIASATTFAKTKIPNFISNMIADVSLQYSTTVGGIKAWIAQANGSGQATWWSPDSPSTAYLAPSSGQCGSSASPLLNQTGLSSTTAYYIVATINPTTLNFTLTLYPSPPTDSQLATACADGSILAVVASSSTGKSITPSGTASGGFSGGGSGRVPQN